MKSKVCCLLLILLSAAAVEAKPSPVSADRVALPYTRKLPPVDKVEIEKFKTSEMRVESIEATKVVEGKEAQAIAALWRTQNYRSTSPICHHPAFGIKFYSRGKLILYASLCWQCDNIVFLAPKLKSKQGFDGDSKKGKELLAVFLKAFS